MTLEERLADALHAADSVEPSPDLFARMGRSIEEARAHRRRLLTVWAAALATAGTVVAWVALSAEIGDGGEQVIDGWKIILAYLFVSGSLVIGLAPNIRRFGRSFIDDVFHLSPATGGRFLAVLDIAYYLTFTGLILVDADVWPVGQTVALFPILGDALSKVGFILLAMGILHTANLAFLPVLGLIYNSVVRRDLRRRAGDAAPPETLRARSADRNARSFAIAVAVVALSLAPTVVVPLIGGMLE
jgi:hypothetical protein